MMPYVYYFIALLAVVYITLLVGLYFYQHHLIFHPEGKLEHPEHYGLKDFKLITLTTADSVQITTWIKSSTNATEPVLVYFHGNRGHIGDRFAKIAMFSRMISILAISYRGFGTSSGLPSEQGLYHDARSALNHLLQQNPDQPIILYGESLGTGIAIQMATEFNISAVILEAPYKSIAARGAAQYPYIPVNHMLKHRFDSITKMKHITAPVLILHGEQDETIPVTDGKDIFAAANEPKELILFPDTHHTDFNLEQLTAHTMQFIAKSLKK